MNMRMNLLPKDERPLKQSQVRWEFLLGLAAFLVLGAVLTLTWVEATRVKALATVHEDALAREAVLIRQVQAVNALREEIKALESQEEVFKNILSPQDEALLALAELTAHGTSDLWIEGVILENGQVSLAGYTRELTSLTGFLNFLAERCDEVDLRYTQPVTSGSGPSAAFHRFLVDVKGVKAHAAAEFGER